MAYNAQPPLGQAAMAASLPVAIAVNQSAVPVIQSSSATVGGAICTASSISGTSGATGGTASLVIGSPAQVYGWYFYNPNTVAAYVSFYNLSSAGGITIGSTTPYYILVIPPVGGANVFGIGITHSNGIVIGISQGRNIATAMPVGIDYNIFYKS